jgi:hypothetical protein
MKKTLTRLFPLAAGLLLLAAGTIRADDLEQLFDHPPDTAKPRVMWMWMGCHLNQSGITRDLEALHDAGFGGTLMFLDLGDVNHIARVRLNGRDLGVVWTAPWRVDISDVAREKANSLEIEITNVWANRLIGDEQEPADCDWYPVSEAHQWCRGVPLRELPDWFLKGQPRPSTGRYCFTTWNYFRKDSPLVPSGLLGPVRLQTAD